MSGSNGKTREANIPSTKNYDIFVMNEVNRDTNNQKKLASLEDSMLKHGFIKGCPIHVERIEGSDNLRVLQGHHRLKVAKKLGLEVFYVIAKDSVPIFDLEATKGQSWSKSDWIKAHARSGKPDYEELIRFRLAHGLTMSSAIALLLNSQSPGNFDARIINGSFTITDRAHAMKVVSITDLCRDMCIEYATKHSFVMAVSACLSLPEFNSDQFILKLSRHPARMKPRSTRNEWLEAIEDLYNYQAKEASRLNVSFMVRESMRVAKATFGGKQEIGRINAAKAKRDRQKARLAAKAKARIRKAAKAK